MARNLMLMGTSSNVGKSILCTALCRILAQDGFKTAPFKSQNMSLNSAVTPSGREIGRAQVVQADACGIAANEHMNPVLLKPIRDNQSQIVLQGMVYETTSARSYFSDRADEIWDAVVESFQFLDLRHECLVIEGAGSPVEMNLKTHEIANMRTAELADADVLLVADIDRGGIFASIVGTLQLLTESERARVKGIIVNKFRGDPRLFDDGVQLLEEYAGVPVLGVIPYIRDIGIEEEDSVFLDMVPFQERVNEVGEMTRDGSAIRIAIIQFPHISNFTDFDPLFLEPGVAAYFCRRPEDVKNAHVIILPGSKNTITDLQWLRKSGVAAAIELSRERGAVVFGVCGGFQMLGNKIRDPNGIESNMAETFGFNWFPVVTTIEEEKVTLLVEGQTVGACPVVCVHGYEIHMGKTTGLTDYQPFASIRTVPDGLPRMDGAVSGDKTVMGTYLHGIFDNDAFRRQWLTDISHRFDLESPQRLDWSMADRRSEAFDYLAKVVRAHLDMTAIYQILGFPPSPADVAPQL